MADESGGRADHHRTQLASERHRRHVSLRRLGTDYVDLYLLHIWDRVTPALKGSGLSRLLDKFGERNWRIAADPAVARSARRHSAKRRKKRQKDLN